MISKLGVKDKAECTVKMGRKVMDGLTIGGVFEVVCRDRDGNIKWQDTAKNLFTNSGLNAVLNYVFHATTQVTWYVGFYSDAAPSASWVDTGDLTEVTAYADNRKEYVEAAADTQAITNSANKASFAINGSATIEGAFLGAGATGEVAVLCAANFSQGSRAIQSGDTVEVTYTCSAADDGV